MRDNGRFFYADLQTGKMNVFTLPQFGSDILPNGLTVHGFGQDANGELYALATNTSANGNGGVVYKLVSVRLTAQRVRQPAEPFLARRRWRGCKRRPTVRGSVLPRTGPRSGLDGDQSCRRSNCANQRQRVLPAGLPLICAAHQLPSGLHLRTPRLELIAKAE